MPREWKRTLLQQVQRDYEAHIRKWFGADSGESPELPP